MALKEYSVTVIGATGYAGGELCRILLSHPHVTLSHVMAKSTAGTLMGEHHPHLYPLAQTMIEPTDLDIAAQSDIIFFALPHGESGKLTQQLRDKGSNALVIDVAADHRLKDGEEWKRYYHSEPQEPWTYGLPELAHPHCLQRDIIKDGHEIAVPGCNVTAVTLALQPAIQASLIGVDNIVATLAVGYSGAGKSVKPHLSASVALDNAQAYSVGGTHRHIPEIIQNINTIDPQAHPKVTMTPVLIPAVRGILATVTAQIDASNVHMHHNEDNARVLHTIYSKAYADEPLVDVLPLGTFPTMAQVRGSARAAIGVTIDQRSQQLIAICAIDNLSRGTASQAIQSMNIALGIPEDTGLPITGVAP